MRFSLLAASLVMAAVACDAGLDDGSEEAGATDNALTESAQRKTYVATVRLNVRERASKSARVLRVLAIGTGVTSLGDTSNGYMRINVSGDEGWALAKFLQVEGKEDT